MSDIRPYQLSGKKAPPLIAIADKSPIVREGLTNCIARDGRFNVAGAVESGEDFLKLLDESLVDIGIVGWSLPDVTGGDLLSELKRRKSKTRVVIYSGETGAGILRQAILLGAWAFVSKRKEPADLLNVIATVAHGHLSLPYVDLRTFAKSPLDDISQRERELLLAIAGGLTNLQIADRFGISRNTVKFHLKNLYDKLEVSNRVMAIRLLLSEEKDRK